MGFGSGEQDSGGGAGDRASASARAVAPRAVAPSAAAANAGKAPSRRTRALGVAAAGLLALGVVWRLGGSAAESTHGALVGGRQAASPPTSDEAARLIGVLLRDAESTWTQLLVPEGHTYTKPKLVLFDDVAEAVCGHAGSLVGPFYCPGDRRLYLDLTFLSELSRRLGPAGMLAGCPGRNPDVAVNIISIMRHSSDGLGGPNENVPGAAQPESTHAARTAPDGQALTSGGAILPRDTAASKRTPAGQTNRGVRRGSRRPGFGASWRRRRPLLGAEPSWTRTRGLTSCWASSSSCGCVRAPTRRARAPTAPASDLRCRSRRRGCRRPRAPRPSRPRCGSRR